MTQESNWINSEVLILREKYRRLQEIIKENPNISQFQTSEILDYLDDLILSSNKELSFQQCCQVMTSGEPNWEDDFGVL